jgi:D-arabinose 1-dehydrogenase-like Zn-dependent alcohol dehydrogenase
MSTKGKIAFLSIIEDSIQIPSRLLVMQNLEFRGSEIPPRECSMQMLQFASEHNVKPRVQIYPLTADGITEALGSMKQGLIRYCAVFTPFGAKECSSSLQQSK